MLTAVLSAVLSGATLLCSALLLATQLSTVLGLDQKTSGLVDYWTSISMKQWTTRLSLKSVVI